MAQLSLRARWAGLAALALVLIMGTQAFSRGVLAAAPAHHATAGATVPVVIQNFAFSPATITVAPGTTIVWTQKDTVGHTVTSDTHAWTQSALLNQNDTFPVTLTKAGTYTYHCAPHPYMKGTIVVQAGAMAGSGSGTSSAGSSMGAMMGPMSTAKLAAFTGYYDGKKLLYLGTDTSSKAEAMRDHINYSAALAKALPSASEIYLITNGAFASRGAVFGSAPGKDDYTPLWQEITVTWHDASKAVALGSDTQITDLAKAGKLTLKKTGVVLNCPIITGQVLSGSASHM